MYTALAIIMAMVGHWSVQALAALVLVDVATGVAAAWRSQTFELKHIADFVGNTVAPYCVVYGAVRLAVFALPEWEPVSLAVWAAMALALSGSIRSNWREAFPDGGDLPLPEAPPHG